MNKRFFLSLVVMVMTMVGCKSTEWDGDKAVTATVVDLTSDAKEEIGGIINQVMPGANVKLADDIFSNDHRLFIQKKQTIVDGNPIQGRIIEMPRKFELYRLEDRCFLIDTKTNASFLLSKVNCQPTS